VLKIWTFSL